MAAISVYEKYKFSYLHSQMNSVWTEYVHCASPPPKYLIHCYIFVYWESPELEKVVNRKYIGINFILTHLFHT